MKNTVTIDRDSYNVMVEAILFTRHAIERNQRLDHRNILNQLGEAVSVLDVLDEARDCIARDDIDARARISD